MRGGRRRFLWCFPKTQSLSQSAFFPSCLLDPLQVPEKSLWGIFLRILKISVSFWELHRWARHPRPTPPNPQHLSPAQLHQVCILYVFGDFPAMPTCSTCTLTFDIHGRVLLNWLLNVPGSWSPNPAKQTWHVFILYKCGVWQTADHHQLPRSPSFVQCLC